MSDTIDPTNPEDLIELIWRAWLWYINNVPFDRVPTPAWVSEAHPLLMAHMAEMATLPRPLLDDLEDLLTITEAAAAMQITPDGVRKAINNGTLPFERRFGRQLIRREALAQYQATKKVGRPRKGDGNESAAS